MWFVIFAKMKTWRHLLLLWRSLFQCFCLRFLALFCMWNRLAGTHNWHVWILVSGISSLLSMFMAIYELFFLRFPRFWFIFGTANWWNPINFKWLIIIISHFVFSLLKAIDLILEGTQNLVVPIKTKLSNKRKQHQKPSPTVTVHKGREFCWLTQEDVIRFLLSSIGLFSPVPAYSIDTLGIISSEIVTIEYQSPASAAIGAISRALVDQTSVAVVDSEGCLIGEISPFTLACCDETVAAAVKTLSSGDLMAYIDCGGPPEDLVRVVSSRLKERNLNGMLEHFSMSMSCGGFSSSSSDEESPLPRSGRYSRSMSYSARMVRRAEAIVCHPKSSLVAVMIQAISHRVNYVWVIEDDCSLVGIVTFSDMLKVFREHLETIA